MNNEELPEWSEDLPEWSPDTEIQTQQSQKPEGWKGVWNDVWNAPTNALKELYQFAGELPQKGYEATGQLTQDPIRFLESLGAGSARTGRGAYNLGSFGSQYLKNKGITDTSINELFPEVEKANYGMGTPRPGEDFIQGVGSYIPFGPFIGAEQGTKGLMQRAGVNAAYGATQNQDPISASLMGLLSERSIQGAQKIPNIRDKFLPSTPLSAAELEQSKNITKGTNTNLGSAIDNQFLKEQYENVLPKIPASGASEGMQRTGKALTNQGDYFLNELKGTAEDTSNIPQLLQEGLASAEETTRSEKNARWGKVNELAEKEGVRTDGSHLVQVAQAELDKINADPRLAKLIDPKVKKLIEDVIEEGKGNYSLKTTDIYRGALGEAKREAFSKGESNLGSIYKKLQNAADKDINSAIDKSKNSELKNLRDDAFKYHKEEWAPFEDAAITKFTREGGDPDVLIQSFIRNSRRSDRGNLLKKLTDKLTEEQKNLLAYDYFSNATTENKFDPQKFRTLFKDLGERQRAALLSSENIKKFSDYSELVKKNTGALDHMRNPKTGYQGLSTIPLDLYNKTITAARESPMQALGVLAPSMFGKSFTNYLESPLVREKIINRLIEMKNRPQRSANISPLLQALIESQQAKDQQNR